MNIIETIRNNLDTMTKSEYNVASYCVENLSEFAFDTLDVIASKIGISTTSVIRFCRRLGFSGYKSFQEQVRLDFKYEPDLPDKLKRTVDNGSGNKLIIKTVNESISCIDKTFSELSGERLYDAVKTLLDAKRVFTFGMKESFAVAHYAYTRLLTVRDNVYMLNAGYNNEIEGVLSLEKGDICVAFLFPRYTRQAVQILDILRKQGVFVILVTASPVELIKDYASIILCCHVNTNGIKNSAVAPVCLMDYLCNALAIANGNKTLEYMNRSEQLFKQFLF